MLLGLITSDEGSLCLLGDDSGRRRSQVRQGVAGFMERPALYPYLSARRNLALFEGLDGNP